MSHFLNADRKTDYLLPPSMDDWLPEGHLARFIVEVIDHLDLSQLVKQYAGRGHKAYHPATLLAILVYGYANGVFSSRKLEQATYDSVAFRYLAAGSHPDHDTLATFRRRFLSELQGLFVQVLELAQEMKLLKVGRVCLDGTKIHANASKHQALSHGHIEQMERHLKAEVQELFALAEQADQAGIPEGVNLPEEIQRRADRLAVMAAAKAKIAERAQARYAKEKSHYDAKMAHRAEREALGQKPRGKAPQAPDPVPKAQDQINLTDEESRIMPVSGGGFEQAYNAQAAVDDQTMLVVATGVSQAPNDKEQVIPMLETLQAQGTTLGPIEALVADTGYCSEKNVEACEALGITPFIAVAREAHHPDWRQRHSEPEALPPENATRMQAMRHRLKTQAGRSVYRLRKQIVEPVFGIIKSVMGFRQFSLRGLRQVQGEWSLVCLSWNIKRMAVLRL